jgi:ribosomal protein S27AE
MKFVTQMVSGVCPDCSKSSILISIEHFFKCTRCGCELEQKVNGKISYIPVGTENLQMILEQENPNKNGQSS